MTASQQHMFDAYRAAQHGTPTPPAPGEHDWQAVRELRDTVRDDLRFRAVVAGQPGRSYLRAAAARLAARLRPSRIRTAETRTAASRTRTAPAVRTATAPRTAGCS
ncbi:hypothetical protein ACH4SP_15855 [Streptomyces sp. NPDC021093]|uniref:hypothetical protein n=1 Tax=Streptomyces sp. NPDC021093 TaxID=3365112 RepID=UPI00379229C5